MHSNTHIHRRPVTYSEWKRLYSCSSREEGLVPVRVRSGPAGRAVVTKVPSYLGLSNASISPESINGDEEFVGKALDESRSKSQGQERLAKGLRGISTYGRWMIRDAGAVFDGLPNYTRGAYTLTCPADDKYRVERWNAKLSEVLRVFHRDLYRECLRRVPPNKKNAPQLKYWAYVIEEQERGAWHSHHMIPLKVDSTDRDLFSIEEMDEFTIQCVRKVHGNLFDDCPLKSFGRLERIRNSVGGYYSKYLTKGTEHHSETRPPTHWWGVSKSLKEAVKERTFDEVFYVNSLDWEKMLFDLTKMGGVQWSYPVLIPAEGLPREYWHQIGMVLVQPREMEWCVASYFEENFGENFLQPSLL